MPSKNFKKKDDKQTQQEEPENPPPTKPKDVKKNQSQKKSIRDDDRMTAHRARTSEKTVQENREALFEKLFFGYKNISEAMKNIELQQVQRTIIVPISTRSAGFIIRNLVARFVRLSIMTVDEAYTLAGSLYRITLLQMDYKLEEAMLLQHSRNLELDSYEDTYLSSDIRRALDMMGAGFSPLVNFISSIGYVKTAAKSYLPRHPKVVQHTPVYQTISTLRRTVEALSSDALDVNVKTAFMEACPIPHARWDIRSPRRTAEGVEVPPGITLANADDIMPPNYTVVNAREDIGIIATWIEKVGRKYPKYVCTGGVDWKSQGSISQIISCNKGRLKCPAWPTNGAISLTSGEHDRFWSAETISDPEAYMGVVYMLGEVDLPSLVESKCAAYRLQQSACSEINLDYVSVMQNLLN